MAEDVMCYVLILTNFGTLVAVVGLLLKLFDIFLTKHDHLVEKLQTKPRCPCVQHTCHSTRPRNKSSPANLPSKSSWSSSSLSSAQAAHWLPGREDSNRQTPTGQVTSAALTNNENNQKSKNTATGDECDLKLCAHSNIRGEVAEHQNKKSLSKEGKKRKLLNNATFKNSIVKEKHKDILLTHRNRLDNASIAENGVCLLASREPKPNIETTEKRQLQDLMRKFSIFEEATRSRINNLVECNSMLEEARARINNRQHDNRTSPSLFTTSADPAAHSRVDKDALQESTSTKPWPEAKVEAKPTRTLRDIMQDYGFGSKSDTLIESPRSSSHQENVLSSNHDHAPSSFIDNYSSSFVDHREHVRGNKTSNLATLSMTPKDGIASSVGTKGHLPLTYNLLNSLSQSSSNAHCASDAHKFASLKSSFLSINDRMNEILNSQTTMHVSGGKTQLPENSHVARDLNFNMKECLQDYFDRSTPELNDGPLPWVTGLRHKMDIRSYPPCRSRENVSEPPSVPCLAASFAGVPYSAVVTTSVQDEKERLRKIDDLIHSSSGVPGKFQANLAGFDSHQSYTNVADNIGHIRHPSALDLSSNHLLCDLETGERLAVTPINTSKADVAPPCFDLHLDSYDTCSAASSFIADSDLPLNHEVKDRRPKGDDANFYTRTKLWHPVKCVHRVGHAIKFRSHVTKRRANQNRKK